MLQSCISTTIQGPGYFYYPIAAQSSTQGTITSVTNNGMTWRVVVRNGPCYAPRRYQAFLDSLTTSGCFDRAIGNRNVPSCKQEALQWCLCWNVITEAGQHIPSAQVDPGFPTDSILGQTSSLLSIVWNRATRTLRQNSTDAYPNTPITKNSDGSYTFQFSYSIPNVFANDAFTVRPCLWSWAGRPQK